MLRVAGVNLSVRPNLGWMAFIWARESYWRIVIPISLLALATCVILQEANNSLTLTYAQPSPYPPPVVLFQRSTDAGFTAFDACAVEAAAIAAKQQHKLTGTKRPVYVLASMSTVGSRLPWVHATNDLEEVRLLYLDNYKLFKHTILEEWFNIGGRMTLDAWSADLSTKTALLWLVGGVMTDTHTFITQELLTGHSLQKNEEPQQSLDEHQMISRGIGDGVVVKSAVGLNSRVFGSPCRSDIASALADFVVNKTGLSSKNTDEHVDRPFTDGDALLLEAVMEACGVSSLMHIEGVSDCDRVRVVQEERVVQMKTDEEVTITPIEDVLLYQYNGSADILSDLKIVHHLLLRYDLNQRCPVIFKKVTKAITGDT